MKKALSWILVFSMLFCLSACASGEQEQEYGLKLQKIYNGEEVTIESDLVSGYMKLTDEAEVAAYLQQYSSKKGDRQQVIFAWEETATAAPTPSLSLKPRISVIRWYSKALRRR